MPRPGAATPSSTSSRTTKVTSSAIADALKAYDGVKVELHISNPAAREEWRRTSVIAPYVTGSVCGFGPAGYRLAIDAVVSQLEECT
jgi:3-dehydroquinate dehydratase-2